MDDGPGLNHRMVVLNHVYPISGNDIQHDRSYVTKVIDNVSYLKVMGCDG